jgi:branched-chain amino acid aminotransferase
MEYMAWSQDRWVPWDQVSIALDDIGFLQGAVIVDRLRTCGGSLLDVRLHVNRLLENCAQVGIVLPEGLDLESLIEECASINRPAFGNDDFSVVTLVTPGRSSRPTAGPTLITHPMPIAWSRLAEWYLRGQTLITAHRRNVPADCWPPTIKTRSRLHYYLAERQAADRDVDAERVHVGAVLLDLQGNLTDTSFANVLIVERGRQIISPPMTSVLNGVGLARTARLAAQAGFELTYEPIPIARAEAAEEILLCGSTGLLWAACRLGEKGVPRGISGPALQSLQQLWIEEIGLDYIQQAIQAASAEGSRTSDR